MSNKLIPLLDDKQQRGSKPRCHLLTDGRPMVAKALTAVIAPCAEIRSTDLWLPDGFYKVTEAQLGKSTDFLSAEQRKALRKWWLKVQGRSTTPNWDIAATGSVQGRPGLVLVEAKAHVAELSTAGKAEPKDEAGGLNHKKIGEAIAEANSGLRENTGCHWSLSRDSHYQLANRFAWGWKLASMGIPVVLVYLGFLGADDMAAPYVPFRDHDHWKDAVLEYSRDIVPADVWEKPIKIGDAQLIPLIRSLRVNLPR